jgi:hypothetical protein
MSLSFVKVKAKTLAMTRHITNHTINVSGITVAVIIITRIQAILLSTAEKDTIRATLQLNQGPASSVCLINKLVGW